MAIFFLGDGADHLFVVKLDSDDFYLVNKNVKNPQFPYLNPNKTTIWGFIKDVLHHIVLFTNFGCF